MVNFDQIYVIEEPAPNLEVTCYNC